MQETAEDRARLDAILAESMAGAGPFLRSSFRWPEHALSLERLLAAFDRLTIVALATSTASGAPRVAPIGCVLIGGTFYIPTTRTAARYRMVERRRNVSLTRFEGSTLAVIVHGAARPVHLDEPEFARVEAVLEELGAESPTTWGRPGDGCYLAIEPRTILTYALEP